MMFDAHELLREYQDAKPGRWEEIRREVATERMRVRKKARRHRWGRRYGSALALGLAAALGMLVSAAVAGALGLMLVAWRWFVGLL